MIRSFRIFRPLRFIPAISGLNLVVNALLESLPSILNVSLLLLTFWLTYGILGIILYKDRFGFCGNDLNFGISQSMVKKIISRFILNYLFSVIPIIGLIIDLILII